MHDVPAHEALVLLEPGHGLSKSTARARLQRVGPNSLPKARRRSVLRRFALQFNHPLIYILLAAAGVALAVGEAVDATVILGVVVVNAVIRFVQEGRAEAALDALAEMVVGEVTLIRDGHRTRVPATQVVPGDLLVLAAGDAVAADTRIVALMNDAFRRAPIDAGAWARITAAGIVAWLIAGTEKLIRSGRRPNIRSHVPIEGVK